MKIEHIEAIPVKIDQKSPFTTHRETMLAREYVIIRVLTSEGITGIGEASTIETWGESQAACISVIREYLAPAITGEDPFHVETILHKMDRVLERCTFSKAAIEMAILDVVGRAVGKPICELIGGRFREWVPQSRSVGIADIRRMVDWAMQLKDMKTATIKIKTGIDGDHDILAVHAIRKAIGEDVKLKVDANTGWTNPKEAIRVLRAIEDCRILLAEQPVRGWDLDGMAMVAKAVDIPIAADESVWDSHDVIRIFEKRAADILTTYLAKAGGITRNREVAAVAKAVGLPCLLGGMGELGVGSAANVQFAAAVPNMELPADLHVPPYQLVDDLIEKPLEFSEQGVRVPAEPGLGVTLDEAKLKRFRID
jgi:muconate cycloisomerase